MAQVGLRSLNPSVSFLALLALAATFFLAGLQPLAPLLFSACEI